MSVLALKIAEFSICNNTYHGCFSCETVIFIEIHAMRINYQFWIILKNLFTSLNQSGVSMIIAESSEDVNPDRNEALDPASREIIVGGAINCWTGYVNSFISQFLVPCSIKVLQFDSWLTVFSFSSSKFATYVSTTVSTWGKHIFLNSSRRSYPTASPGL